MKTNAKIYVMRGEDGSLKLGHSKNPATRSKQLGRAVEIVHQTDVLEHAEHIERLAHRVLVLHGKHIKGEWFEASLADAITAIEIAVKQAERQELHLGGKLKGTRHDGRSMRQLAIRFTDEQLSMVDRIIAQREGEGEKAGIIREALTRGLKAMLH